MIFEDREDAGSKLAALLQNYRGPNTIVLAIPRGGVEVGYEIATALDAPLDVVIPRKIGAPGQPELAIGAIGDDETVLDGEAIGLLGVSEDYIREEIERQREEMWRRRHLYRGDRPFPDLEGKTVLLVDDGVATGSTTIAAARSLRKKNPAELVLTVPIAPPETVGRLRREVDHLIVLDMPDPFFSVGSWYSSFDQTSDEVVISLLHKADRHVEAQEAAT